MDKKKLIILVACLAVLLVACIIVAVVLMGNEPGKLPENPTETTEQTQPADETEDGTEPDGTSGTTAATEPAATTDATQPSQGGNTGSGNTGAGNQGSTGGNNNTATEPTEEDKTPTIGVDDETTPTGSEENNMVIDFDDLLDAANKKKNEG